MNHGLVLISPVILVRVLSVYDFGRYREFLLYSGLLITMAAFGINSSLLRFVPDDPRTGWRFVNQAVLMTLTSSTLVVSGMLVLNALFDGRLVGEYAVPVALYVFLYVNLDFWESLWLAEKQSFAVLRYSTARLVARIVVATTSAILTHDVATIIGSLICLEAVRLVISFAGWRSRQRASASGGPLRWREQLAYCIPFGAAIVFVGLNRSMGSLFVAKMLGPVALAHYAVGTYLQPIISVIRNSLSDVVLPEMISRERGNPAGDRLRLWRRTTVVTAIMLIGIGVVLAKFADVIVVTLFSAAYRPAVVLFQIYVLVFLREVMDFSVPLRAMNRTAPIMHSNLIAVASNAAFMLVLMPLYGSTGAVIALVLSRFVEGGYLAVQMARAYEIPMRALAPWGDLLKVLAAAAVAALALYGQFWTEYLGLLGAVLGSGLFALLFAALLLLFQVPEAMSLVHALRAAPLFRRRESGS